MIFKIISDSIFITIFLFSKIEIIKLILILFFFEFIKLLLSNKKTRLFPKIFYRPYNTKLFGFPSSHVLIATLLYLKYDNILSFIYLLLISISRLELYYHNYFQVICGFIFGLIIKIK